MTNKLLKLIGYIVVCISLMTSVAPAAVVAPAPKITLSWNYPADRLSADLTFKIYHSTDLAVPMKDWTVVTNVVGTSLSAKLPMAPGPHFFTVTAADSSGESDFATTSF
jgi:hypothetical protein